MECGVAGGGPGTRRRLAGRWGHPDRRSCQDGWKRTLTEQRQLPYLSKLRQTQNVARTIARLARNKKAEWQNAGQGWEGVETELQLQGWTRQRRVIVLRRKLAEPPVKATGKGGAQGCLPGTVVEQANGDWYEHAVLVTSWEQSDVRVLAQAYRDRTPS